MKRKLIAEFKAWLVDHGEPESNIWDFYEWMHPTRNSARDYARYFQIQRPRIRRITVQVFEEGE